MRLRNSLKCIIVILLFMSLLAGCRSIPAEDDISKLPKEQFCGTGKMQVVFPENWNNKWNAEFPGNDVIQIYHEKLYEGQGMGHLCTFARFTDEIYKEYPAYEVLKETKEAVYVIIYPSDVQFDPADQQSTEEYLDMFNSINEVIEKFKVIGED